MHQGGPGSSSIWLWLRAHLLRPSGSPCLRNASTVHVAFAGAPCGPPTSESPFLWGAAARFASWHLMRALLSWPQVQYYNYMLRHQLAAKLSCMRAVSCVPDRVLAAPQCLQPSAAASVRISAPTGTAPTSFPLTRTGCRTCTFWSHLLYYIHWAASPPLRSSGGATKAIFICSSHTRYLRLGSPYLAATKYLLPSCHQIMQHPHNDS